LTTGPTAGATRNPGGCLQPVLLRGRVDHLDGATGELLLPLYSYPGCGCFDACVER
jgi:hypothetical protein